MANNLIYSEDPVPHIVIDDLFSEQELFYIKDELQTLYDFSKKSTCVDTYGNTVDSFIDKRKEIWINSFFPDQKDSKIISLFREKVSSENLLDIFNKNTLFSYVNHIFKLSGIVGFYEDGDFIKPHEDYNFFTMNLMLGYSVPENSELYLSNNTFKNPLSKDSIKIKKIDFKPGRLVVFPSKNLHWVDPIKCKSSKLEDLRITIQFWGTRS